MNSNQANFDVNNYPITNFAQANSDVRIVFIPMPARTDGEQSNNTKFSFLNQFQELVEEYYDDDQFKAKQVAKLMNLSESQLFRRLKSLTNQGFTAYLRWYRLQKAKDLLENNQELSISEIAYEVGFNDPNYFSRSFSEAFGLSPRSLRKKYC